MTINQISSKTLGEKVFSLYFFQLIMILSISLLVLSFMGRNEQAEWAIYISSSITSFFSLFVLIKPDLKSKINNNSSFPIFKTIIFLSNGLLLLILFSSYFLNQISYRYIIFTLLSFLPSILFYKSSYKSFWKILLVNSLSIFLISLYFFLYIDSFSNSIFLLIASISPILYFFIIKNNFICNILKEKKIIFSKQKLFIIMIILSSTSFYLIKNRYIDFHHYSFYVGPAYEISLGKSILNESASQYGYLSIHFIETILKNFEITFQTFHIMNLILFVIYFSLAFFIFLKITKNSIVSFILYIIAFFFQVIFTIFNGVLYPSTGPLRFGLSMLIIMSVLYLPKKTRIFFSTLLSGISLFWSIETAIYVIPAWVYVLFINNFINFKSINKIIINFLRNFKIFILTILAILFFIIFKESSMYSEPLKMLNYVQFATIYKNGSGSQLISLFENYSIAVAIMILGLTLSIFSALKKQRGNIFIILNFLSIHNIAVFSYFVGRSHENNIVNISMFLLIELVVCYKVIEIIFFQVNKQIQFYKYSLMPSIIFSTLFIFVCQSHSNAFKLSEPLRQDQPLCVIEYRNLKSKYSLNQKNVIIASAECDSPIITDNHIYTYLPLNPLKMTELLPNYIERYIDPNLSKIPIGTFIVSTKDTPELMEVFNRKFTLEKVGSNTSDIFEVFTITNHL